MENQPMNNLQSKRPASAPVGSNPLMGIICYIGPLVLVSYLVAKDDPFVSFHTRQGMVLFIIEVALWFMGMMIWILLPLIQIINIVLVVLAIIGIFNVIQRKDKPLPLVGQFAQYF